MIFRKICSLVWSLTLTLCSVIMLSCSGASINPVQLTCEYDANAFIDIQNPRLSWVNENVKQTRGVAQ